MSDWVQKQMDRIRREEVELAEKGGPGSGHHGHAGRPGQRGGSAPGKGGGGGGGGEEHPKWAESQVVRGTGLMKDDTLASIAGDLRKASKYGWIGHPAESQALEDMEKILRYRAGDRADALIQSHGPPDAPGSDLYSGLNRNPTAPSEHLPITNLLRNRTLAKIVADLSEAEKQGWIGNDNELWALDDARNALRAMVGDKIDNWIANAHKRGIMSREP